MLNIVLDVRPGCVTKFGTTTVSGYFPFSFSNKEEVTKEENMCVSHPKKELFLQPQRIFSRREGSKSRPIWQEKLSSELYRQTVVGYTEQIREFDPLGRKKDRNLLSHNPVFFQRSSFPGLCL